MFDANLIVANFFSKLTSLASEKIWSAAEESARKLIDELKTNFATYLQNTFNRYSKVRTLLNRDEAVNTSAIYVKTKFKTSHKTIEDFAVLKNIVNCERICIIGSGGCGKSMFMKHALLNMLENETGKIPIFVELRNINSIDNKNLANLIHYTINGSDGGISTDQFGSLLQRGSFVIMLDGFDEIHLDYRSEVEKQILELSNRYKDCGFIVSSRDDPRFHSWVDYKLCHVLPMELAEVVSLISKMKYDSGVKKKFIENIKHGLYKKHKSFLSNPLLATMMLLTYDQFSHIPDKIHLFYEQAFETLYFRHDSSKEAGYVRKMRTSIPINDFKDCISSMCISTYTKEKYIFNESEILGHLKKALEFEKISEKPVDMLGDLLESVCIMQREGLYISFTHRSFQEYFSAHFISRSPSRSLPSLLDHLIKRPQDNAIGMAYDMNSSLLEREWLQPRLKNLLGELAHIDPRKEPRKLWGVMFGSVTVVYNRERQDFSYIVEEKTEWSDFVTVIQKIFPIDFKQMGTILTGHPNNNVSLSQEFRRMKKFPRTRLPNKKTKNFDELSVSINFNDCDWLRDGELLECAPYFVESLSGIEKKLSLNVRSKEAMVNDLFT